MKISKYKIMMILPALLFAGCAEDIPSSELITFPTFTLTGENMIFLAEGESYLEPGAVAFEGDSELSVEASVTGRFNADFSGSAPGAAPDFYVITYSAISSAGFVGTATRTVIVAKTGDLVADLSGLYRGTTVRSTGEAYSDMLVLIWNIGGDTYEISGSIGHFYADGRQFGDACLARGGTITVNSLPSNDFSFTDATLGCFGLGVGITSMTVNPNTKTVEFHGSSDQFGNADWDVTMVQLDL